VFLDGLLLDAAKVVQGSATFLHYKIKKAYFSRNFHGISRFLPLFSALLMA
jgi:hypothetical protein